MKRKIYLIIVLIILATQFLSACAGNTDISSEDTQPTAQDSSLEETNKSEENEATDETIRPSGWSEETHGKEADPDYEVVFPNDAVNAMTITIAPDDWQAMLNDMTATHGELGSNSRSRGQGVIGQDEVESRPEPPAQGEPGVVGQDGVESRPEPPAQGEPGVIGQDGVESRPELPTQGESGGGRPAGGGPGGMAGGNVSTENPIWVTSTIEFEGDIWTDVGVRFKGNSSLTNAWSNGSLEMPFKLDFDEYEDENPAIEDQRFYGFKQLSLSNNTNDATFMRDAVAADIMAEAGLASAETAFYELFVDYGEGPVSFGLYTMIEVIDDTVIDRVFGDDDGNIYEADGTAASFAEGTFDGISVSFQKENNEDEADWSDIEALYTALHSDTRQTDPATWKAELEAIFDVDTFLHWLAINTVIENWDTYGGMTHNFYLYNNPETGLLTWIPWDHNEALSEGKRSSMTLSMDAIDAKWPLISYLLADSDYYNTYVSYVDETINTVFVADEMAEKYQEIASLIEPYATEKIGAEAFARGIQALIDHTYTQVSEAENFVAQETQQ